MEVILLEKIQNLGDLGEKIIVKPGYARNFLLPKKKAIVANTENLVAFEARRAELEKAAKETLDAATAGKTAIEAIGSIAIEARSGDEGKLFGSIGNTDLAEAISKAGAEVAKRDIRLPEGPICHTGEFKIGVHLHSDVNVEVTVVVTAE